MGGNCAVMRGNVRGNVGQGQAPEPSHHQHRGNRWHHGIKSPPPSDMPPLTICRADMMGDAEADSACVIHNVTHTRYDVRALMTLSVLLTTVCGADATNEDAWSLWFTCGN